MKYYVIYRIDARYVAEVDQVCNDNVEGGCCGGCM